MSKMKKLAMYELQIETEMAPESLNTWSLAGCTAQVGACLGEVGSFWVIYSWFLRATHIAFLLASM